MLFGGALRRFGRFWRLLRDDGEVAELEADLLAVIGQKLLLDTTIVPVAAGMAAKIAKFHDLHRRIGRSDTIWRREGCGFTGRYTSRVAPEYDQGPGSQDESSYPRDSHPLHALGLGLLLFALFFFADLCAVILFVSHKSSRSLSWLLV